MAARKKVAIRTKRSDGFDHEELEREAAEAASYMSHLTRHKLLTHQQEIDLSERVQAGDGRAKQELVEANMRLVINIAKHYHHPLVPFEDLVQERSEEHTSELQ